MKRKKKNVTLLHDDNFLSILVIGTAAFPFRPDNFCLFFSKREKRLSIAQQRGTSADRNEKKSDRRSQVRTSPDAAAAAAALTFSTGVPPGLRGTFWTDGRGVARTKADGTPDRRHPKRVALYLRLRTKSAARCRQE